MPGGRGMLTSAKREKRDLGTILPLARDLSDSPEQEKMGWRGGEQSVSVEGKEPSQTPKQNAEVERDVPLSQLDPLRRRAPGSHSRDTYPQPSGCRAGTSWPGPCFRSHLPTPGQLAPGAPGRGPVPIARVGARSRAWSRREALGALG